LKGEEIFSQLVSPEKDEAIIQANVTYVNSNRISEIVNGLESYFGKINGFDFSVKQTGMPLIYKHLDDAIIKSQIQSLIFALIFVFVIISFQLSSIVGGLLGIVPVSLTILVVYGFMGYAGIPLDIATVLIASVSIGMGIDYAIHFFNRLKMELKEGVSIEQGLSRVLGTTGVAILINALSVSLGFLVLVFSNVVPLQRFGVMILLTMVLSAGATLVLLPAIILIFKPRFLVKSLEIKLKEEVVQ
jgi:predicted RND superfamily exporter protein